MSDGHTLSVRFPTKKIVAELKRIASAEERSLNYVIVKACEELIAKRESTNAK